MAVEFAKRSLTIQEVTEKNGKIYITGLSAEAIARDIKYIYDTSKIASAMFISVNWARVIIPAFFALEFQYVLKRLVKEPKYNLWTSRRVLTHLIEQLETKTWISNISVPQQPWLQRKHLKEIIYDNLFPHQTEFLDVYERTRKRYSLKGMLLAAAPGLGKTATACSIALVTEATKVIVIAPNNSLHRVWQKTLNQEFKVPQNPYIGKDHPNELYPDNKWHIFHYEQVDRAINLLSLFSKKENICIIVDECHNFNEIKSTRTQRLVQLCQQSGSENIIWMSGTPVKAMGFETIPLLKAIDPYFSPEAEQGFKKMYGKDAKRTLELLAYRIGLISHTTPASENKLPDPIPEQINVSMPNSAKYTLPELSKVMQEFIKERTLYYVKHKAQYKAIFDEALDFHRKTLRTPEQLAEFKQYMVLIDFLRVNGFDSMRDGDKAVRTNKYEKEKIHPSIPKEMRKPFQDAKSVVKYADLKIRGECLGRILTKERVQCHVDMLNYIDFDGIIKTLKKKCLIFTSYVAVVDACYNLLTSKKYTPLRVYGDTNNELAKIVQRFDKDQSINPLIATFDSLSTAVPLTMANGVIFLNAPWRSYIKDQAIARAHRIGQDTQVYEFNVILDTGKVPNISSRSLDIMQWSKDQVDAIMGFNGDVTVSVESNGFVMPENADYNEVIEDVLWSSELQRKQVVPTEVEAIESIAVESRHYPNQYMFYNQG